MNVLQLSAEHTIRGSIRRHLVLGGALTAILAGGVGGWAATTEFSGAVISQGYLVVNSRAKKVQHATGGVVAELYVREGDHVRAGDVLVRLDDTIARASFEISSKTLDELLARQDRLEAEVIGATTLPVPDEFRGREQTPDIVRILAGEQRLLDLRLATSEGQKAQLRQRVEQLANEASGLEGQISAKKKERALIEDELRGVRELWHKKLIQVQRVTALERDSVRLEGEQGQLVAALAQAGGKITEIELEILQIDQSRRSDIAKEQRELQVRIAELRERKGATADQLDRVVLRAPQGGIVHQMEVHTIGGVVSAGEVLMTIIPDTDLLTAEVRIPPQDIDQVRRGQTAVLRFTAFNQRTTPEIEGEVTRVSADLVTDQRSGAAYFTAEISTTEAEIVRLGGLRLVPGMPVEAFVRTGDRTVFSYLTKPLIDQIVKSFRER